MTETRPFRIVLVDDHALMRNGLEAIFRADPGYEIVASEADLQSAITAISGRKADVLLMDLIVPRSRSVEAIASIRASFPDLRIVVLTFEQDDKYLHGSLESGADAYVLKDDSRDELLAALTSVTQGRKYLSPAICAKVIEGYLSNGAIASRMDTSWELLTKREQQVIRLIAAGLRTKDIAEKLSLSPKTIEKHRTNLMKKLDLHSVSAVTVYAIRNGLYPG